MGIRTVGTEAEAAALADLLNGAGRKRPVVVVTTPAGHPTPRIDVTKIDRELGDLADVYLMPTGPHTWAFSRKMAELTQVYGGAGRVYPVGHDWVSNPRRSPLRFAYHVAEGERATDLLVDDALGMAAEAGLTTTTRGSGRVHREGIVEGIFGERAMVRLDRDWGNVSPGLVVAGLPLERVLTKGMRLSGQYDPASHWFDVRESVRDPAEALAGYTVGDVVLVEVDEVGSDSATVFLHPQVHVTLERADVTSNELDDLRSLMSLGEVLAARVVGTAPHWRLSLDVDDDEEPEPAVALIAGGPPWLEAPVFEPIAWEPAGVALPAIFLPALPEPLPTIEPVATVEAPNFAETESPAQLKPTPAIFDPRRRGVTPQGPGPRTPTAPAEQSRQAGAAASMSLTISALRSEVAELKSLLEPLRSRVSGVEFERQELVRENARHRATIEHRENELRQVKSQLRKAKQARPTMMEAPSFADPARGFRHAVETAWARRTPTSEQGVRPLPSYLVGPEFLPSVQSLEGIATEKIADVAFEILTGLARELTSRDLHQLRESEAGGAPVVRRPSDGAVAWRAALQRNTPGARRLHYWQLPSGEIELWYVGVHDDVRAH
jgi:hypothetical protein